MKNVLSRPAFIREAGASGRGFKLWLEILIFILVFIVISIIQMIFVAPFEIYYLYKNMKDAGLNIAAIINDPSFINKLISLLPESFSILMLFTTIIIILCAIIYCRFIEKRSLRNMGFVKQGILKEYISGVVIGAVMFSVSVLLCIVTGSISVTSASKDFAIWIIILFFIGYIIQGMSEEVLCRGYFMVSVARKNSLIAAILANSVIFGLLHLLNSGVTVLAIINIIFFGIFVSIYMIKRGNIWGAAAIHTSWNFVQGNIFGVQVSGSGLTSSVFNTTLYENKTFMNGGAFGLEGGFAVTVVLVVAIVLTLLVKSKEEAV